MEENPWKKRFERERKARKTAEELLEKKSSEVYHINKNLEELIYERTLELEVALKAANIAKETKSNFLANMSHEIRTPMNAIIGFTQLLLETNLDKTQKEYINIVNSSTKTLISIINDILDYSKIESGKVEIDLNKINLAEELKNNILLFSNDAKTKGIDYQFFIDDRISECLYVDIHKLKQVLSNLINNAIKFTNKNKQININIILSEEGKGSKFFFELNLNKCELKDENLNSSIDNKISNSIENLNILVVDDNQINLLLISEILKKLNSKFTLAQNGQIAIDKCKEAYFDIILMDINIPVLNGIEATKILREEHNLKSIIIALTANSLEGDKEKFIENGMDDYLSKPFNHKQFLDILKKHSNII